MQSSASYWHGKKANNVYLAFETLGSRVARQFSFFASSVNFEVFSQLRVRPCSVHFSVIALALLRKASHQRCLIRALLKGEIMEYRVGITQSEAYVSHTWMSSLVTSESLTFRGDQTKLCLLLFFSPLRH